jgi:succinate-acetate transporter protein
MRGDERASVVLTPIATPLPLTFVGLLLATMILSGLELGWIPASETHDAGWALIAVPIPLQLTAGIFGFHGRSATAATGSSVLAAAWLGIALNLIEWQPGSFTPSHAVGMLAFPVGAALLVPAASDLRAGAPLPAAVLIATSARFAVTGIAAMTESNSLRTATGVVGCVVAVLAFYAALALELEDNSVEDTLLPTFRFRQSAQALNAPLDLQVEQLENEAGVRKNL